MAKLSLSNEAFIDTAGAFFDAAARKILWTQALERAGELIGASRLCLIAANYEENQFDFMQNIGYDLSPWYRHQEDLVAIDPLSAAAANQPVGAQYRNYGQLSKREFMLTDAYDLLYAESDVYNHLTTVLARDQKNFAYFGVYTGLNDEDFSAEQKKTIAMLAPYIRRALEVKATLDSATEPAADYIEETNGDAAIFLLDSKGRFIAMNRTADDQIKSGVSFDISRAELKHRNSVDDINLQKAIRACRNALEAGQPWQGVNLTVQGKERQASLAVRIFPIYGQQTIVSSIFRPVRPSIMVVARETTRINGIYEAALQSKYGLTTRESEIAANISRGVTVKEIAVQDGITANAVRFHLKNIFSKMGVRSQAELVSKVLSDHH